MISTTSCSTGAEYRGRSRGHPGVACNVFFCPGFNLWECAQLWGQSWLTWNVSVVGVPHATETNLVGVVSKGVIHPCSTVLAWFETNLTPMVPPSSRSNLKTKSEPRYLIGLNSPYCHGQKQRSDEKRAEATSQLNILFPFPAINTL